MVKDVAVQAEARASRVDHGLQMVRGLAEDHRTTDRRLKEAQGVKVHLLCKLCNRARLGPLEAAGYERVNVWPTQVHQALALIAVRIQCKRRIVRRDQRGERAAVHFRMRRRAERAGGVGPEEGEVRRVELA